MAKLLNQHNAEIVNGSKIELSHIKQFADAFTGEEAYDVEISGSLTVNGIEIKPGPAVVQNTGTSETAVMSQKAVSDELALKANQIELDQLTGEYSQFETDLNNIESDILIVKGYSVISGSDSTMDAPNNWVDAMNNLSFDVNTTIAGKMFLNFTSGDNRAIKLTNKLIVGNKYRISVKARLNSGAGNMNLSLGSFFAFNPGTHSMFFKPTSVETEFTGEITAQTADVWLGGLLADNNGSDFEIDDIQFFDLDTDSIRNLSYALNLKVDYKSIEELVDVPSFPVSDAYMRPINNWYTPNVGTLGHLDINKSIDGIEMNFISGANQWIILDNVIPIGTTQHFKAIFTAEVEGAKIKVGNTLSSENVSHINEVIISLPVGKSIHYFDLTEKQGNGPLYIGLNADLNAGNKITVRFCSIITPSELNDTLNDLQNQIDNINPTVTSLPISFNTEHFLSSLSRYDKPLTKLFVNGDSLMANQIGGVVPDFEGEGAFPLMLSVNNIARRIYDLISWNKPIWRNLFHGDWTKSGWTDDKANVLNRAHSLEHYYLSINGATASITIPENYENFAILCRKSTTAGSLNVTIDGVAVTVGNPNPTMTAAFNNSFHVEEYIGISPTGDKTLQIESVGVNHVWGIMYWSGNTLMVSNIARGGHDMGMLKNYWNAEFIQNNPDAIIFEIPELNQLRGTIANGLTDLEYFVDQLKFKDHCFMSCNALGTDPSDGTPNYWDSYLDPNQRDFNDAFRNLLFKAGEPFIDVLHAFELKVLNRGGTLEDGDCGLWYTYDGQHGSEAGQREWWNIIRYVFENKPIRYS